MTEDFLKAFLDLGYWWVLGQKAWLRWFPLPYPLVIPYWLLFVNHLFVRISLCVLAGSHVISCCSLNNIYNISQHVFTFIQYTQYIYIQYVLYRIYIDNTFGTLLWTCKCNPRSTIFSYVGASTFPPLHFGFRSLSTKDLSDSALRRGKLSGIKD